MISFICYYKSLMTLVGIGSELDPNRLELATKKKWKIPNAQEPEFAPYKLQESKRYSEELAQNKNAHLRSISGTYNCAGMVFAARRTFIEEKHIQRILNDDGYRRIDSESDIVVGDVIVYRRNVDRVVCHIGIVVEIRSDIAIARFEFYILSKWGESGEFLHTPYAVPDAYLLNTTIEYWSERFIP